MSGVSRWIYDIFSFIYITIIVVDIIIILGVSFEFSIDKGVAYFAFDKIANCYEGKVLADKSELKNCVPAEKFGAKITRQDNTEVFVNLENYYSWVKTCNLDKTHTCFKKTKLVGDKEIEIEVIVEK